MKKIFLLAALLISMTVIASEGKTIYIFLPSDYVFQDQEVIKESTQTSDDFCRLIETVQEKIYRAGFNFEPTVFKKKLYDFAGLILCEFPWQKLKKIKKYPWEKIVYFGDEAKDASHTRSIAPYVSKMFDLDDDVNLILEHLGIPVVEEGKEENENAAAAPELEEERVDNGPLINEFETEQFDEPATAETHELEIVASEAPQNDTDDTQESVTQDAESVARQLPEVSIVGERVYESGQIIQLNAQPEGAAYSWKGPNHFGATTQKIALLANASNAGIYEVDVRVGEEIHNARAFIFVTEKVIAKPEASRQLAVSAPDTAVSNPVLIIKTTNMTVKKDMVTFTITVFNPSDRNLTNIQVTDVLPPCLALRNVEGSAWRVTATDDGFIAQTNRLNEGEKKSLIVTAHHVATHDEKIYNKATVSSAESAERTSMALLP